MALRTERHCARMSKIKNSGLDQYGAEPFEQQQFRPAGVEGVKTIYRQLAKQLAYSDCNSGNSDLRISGNSVFPQVPKFRIWFNLALLLKCRLYRGLLLVQ